MHLLGGSARVQEHPIGGVAPGGILRRWLQGQEGTPSQEEEASVFMCLH
jgi:hypothetical protein